MPWTPPHRPPLLSGAVAAVELERRRRAPAAQKFDPIVTNGGKEGWRLLFKDTG